MPSLYVCLRGVHYLCVASLLFLYAIMEICFAPGFSSETNGWSFSGNTPTNQHTLRPSVCTTTNGAEPRGATPEQPAQRVSRRPRESSRRVNGVAALRALSEEGGTTAYKYEYFIFGSRPFEGPTTTKRKSTAATCMRPPLCVVSSFCVVLGRGMGEAATSSTSSLYCCGIAACVHARDPVVSMLWLFQAQKNKAAA